MAIIRQSHSIFTIASLIHKRDIQDLLPVPMAVYVLSLAFSITYGQMREEKLPSARQTAKEHLHLFHQCLKTLGSTWWSASIMTRLGNRVLSDTHHGSQLERSIDPIRSNSQDMSTHSTSHQTNRDVQHLSHSSIGLPQASGESEGTSMNVNSGNHHNIGSDHSTNLYDLIDSPDMMSGNIEEFNAFFDSFSDINVLRSAGDQSFLDFEMLNS